MKYHTAMKQMKLTRHSIDLFYNFEQENTQIQEYIRCDFIESAKQAKLNYVVGCMLRQ
jgi:menaquinone-dependent protoporphyrinogen IX oxidase